jgi:O-antigen ligase
LTSTSRPFVLGKGALVGLTAVLIIWAAGASEGWVALVTALIAVAALCAMVLVAAGGPAVTLSVGLALMMFSGYWGNLGSPLPLDRIVMGIGLGSLLIRAETRTALLARAREPISILLGVVAIYGLFSAAHAGTLRNTEALYGLLDGLGIIPFALYVAAPVAFSTRRDRDTLLMTMVLVGAYLGLTALFETIHLTALIFPKYINNPAVGIHYGRARGPFLEASANGLVLFGCAVAATVAANQWRGQLKALFAGVVVILCAGGILFTLTRAIWISSVLAPLITLLLFKETRKYFLPAAMAVALVAVTALIAIPGLSSSASERESEKGPIWQRLNTDAAALRMVEARPLIGFGWHTFEGEGGNYMRLPATYPETGAGLQVHNVFLGHLAELGLVGTTLWLWALLWAIYAGGIRAGPASTRPWRIGFVAIAISFLFQANFVPLTYALPNALFWLWAGLASDPREIEEA